MNSNKIFKLGPDDPAYPPRLAEIDKPPILYVQGNLDALAVEAYSIVGTREASTFGAKLAKKAAKTCAAKGFCVVSGMARGIDQAAHLGAMEEQGLTIAVLAWGLQSPVSETVEEFQKQILENNGALVSELPIGESAKRWTFARRNRIQSGISKASIIVECSEKSGTMIHADFARKQRRPIYAFASDNFQPAGNMKLLKENKACQISDLGSLRKAFRINPKLGDEK